MTDTSDFKNGLTIDMDGDVYQIIEFQHVKPGKGGAFVRTKIKKLTTGQTIDKTFRAGESIETARVERYTVQYLYSLDDDYIFMNNETFDQITIPSTQLGDQVKFLKDNSDVMIISHGERILGVELPDTIEVIITQTDPGLKGDTASGGSKPAVIETGATINVPLFVNEGDKIRVDTRNAKYLERVK